MPIHLYREDNIVEDNITVLGDEPVNNVARFIEFILKKKDDP